VGSSLATQLTQAGHTVAIIDRRSDAFNRLPAGFSGQIISGVGFDRDRLLEAGIERANAVAAVTSGDNSNVLIARVARETFGIDHVVARIYDPRRAAIYERLGIATVATVAWTTTRVLRKLVQDSESVEWIDASAKLCLVERTLGVGWAGHRILELEEHGPVRVVGVGRLGKTQLPSASIVAQDGDTVYLAIEGDSLQSLEALLAGPALPHGGH
jgi:trk system potassium uptake protein TrkA